MCQPVLVLPHSTCKIPTISCTWGSYMVGDNIVKLLFEVPLLTTPTVKMKTLKESNTNTQVHAHYAHINRLTHVGMNRDE